MNFIELYTTFDGRIPRKSYWLGLLLLVGILIILWLIVGFLFIGGMGAGGGGEALVQLAFTALIAYPATALMVKRLHDRNRPGIIAAIFWTPSILQILGQLTGLTTELAEVGGTQMYLPNTLGWIVLSLGLVIGIWALIELGILRGTNGPNDYGPDPMQ